MSIQSLAGSAGMPQSLPAPRVTGPASPPASVAPPKAEQARQAMERIQRSVPLAARNLQFIVDEGTGKTVITVVNSKTRETVRQIATEEIVSIARALDRMQGLLFNSRA